MAQIFKQSPESKYIKRINEQLAEVNRLLTKEAPGVENNPLIAKWSRAIRESGVEFSKENGRYKIRNTKENREKVKDLETALKKYKPQTAGEYRADIKKELENEAKKTAKRFYKSNTKKDKQKRKKLENHLVSKEKIQARVKAHLQEYEIQNMLDYIYQYEGNKEFGQTLSDITKGKSGERDPRKVFNEFGRIRQHYIDLMYNNVKNEHEEEAKTDLQAILSDMSLGEAFPDEGVQTSGTMGKTRKRSNKKRR
jgi:hypothetical protein